MKKNSKYALIKSIICLLKIHQGQNNITTNFYIARDKYIKSTIKLLEEALELEQKKGWF